MRLWRLERTGRRVVAMAGLMTLGFVSPTHGTAPPDDGSQPVADSPGSFAVQPSGPDGPGGRDYFIYTLKAGQVFGDIVAVSNLGNQPATFAIYATDALNTSDGAFTLLKEEDKPTDVGTWIEMGATQYTLEPGERADIPFRLTVPAEASPGDHVGAIVAQRVPDASDPADGIGFDVRVRIGARMYVRVDGPLTPSLTVDSFVVTYDTPASPFTSGTAKVNYVVRNTGNIRLSPTAKLDVAGLFGLGKRTLPDRQIPELLPGSSLEIAETVPGLKPYGRLTATLELESLNDGVSVRSSVQIWTIPWLAVAIPLAVIAGFVAYRVIARRRRRRRTAAVAGASGG